MPTATRIRSHLLPYEPPTPSLPSWEGGGLSLGERKEGAGRLKQEEETRGGVRQLRSERQLLTQGEAEKSPWVCSSFTKTPRRWEGRTPPGFLSPVFYSFHQDPH